MNALLTLILTHVTETLATRPVAVTDFPLVMLIVLSVGALWTVCRVSRLSGGYR